MTTGRARLLGPLLAPLLLLGTGCGSDHHAAPAPVATALSRVDRFVAAHDYAAARLALDDLVRRTTAARDAGALGAEQAERITAAAAQLGAALPAQPAVAPAPAASPSPAAKAPVHRRKRHRHHGDGEGGD